MKVLFVGVYRDYPTGWSRAAIDYILSMDAAGIDVVPRPLKLNSNQPKLPERILELEGKPSAGCDVAIQHVLPHQVAYDGRLKNICLFASETSNFRASAWPQYLNMMDEIWLINHQQFSACRNSGVKSLARVIPHAIDVARFKKDYPEFAPIKKQESEFIFYSIGEFVRRKNWGALFKCYLSEFRHNEPVRLVLKTSMPGKSPKEAMEEIIKFIKGAQHELKIKKVPPITILTERYSDDEIMSLHQTGDCFVSTSFGEAWNIPAFDAACMNNQVILSSSTGHREWGNSAANVHLVPTTPEIAFGANDTFQDLYTGHEYWYSPHQIEFQMYMRSVFEKHWEHSDKEEEKQSSGLSEKYSYAAVGDMILKALQDGQEKVPKRPRTTGAQN